MFQIGADPELFLTDAAGGLVSSIGKIGGSKENPRPLPIKPGFAVQEDNVALEFNVPPAGSQEEFNLNIGAAIEYLSSQVLAQYQLQFSKLSAASFPKDQLKDPAALVFGCDPDFNAWTGKRNPRPKAADKSLRSCGGHVHVGYEFKSEEEVRSFIRLCDLFLGVPSVLMDAGELRKKLYGKAGAFRYKPYGCEYRSLSNFWVFDSGLRDWVYNGVDRSVLSLRDGMDVRNLEAAVLTAVNNNDKTVAKRLVNQFNIAMV